MTPKSQIPAKTQNFAFAFDLLIGHTKAIHKRIWANMRFLMSPELLFILALNIQIITILGVISRIMQ